MNDKKIIEFITSIWDKLGTEEQNKMIVTDMSQLVQYQVIVALPTLRDVNKLDFIGYPVQVRKGAGAFGSDIVFMRDANGDLSTWENQGFLILNEDQLSVIESHFEEYLEEDKEYKGECTIDGEYPETGWIIYKPKSMPHKSSSVEITIKDKADNITSKLLIQG